MEDKFKVIPTKLRAVVRVTFEVTEIRKIGLAALAAGMASPEARAAAEQIAVTCELSCGHSERIAFVSLLNGVGWELPCRRCGEAS